MIELENHYFVTTNEILIEQQSSMTVKTIKWKVDKSA